MNTKHTPGPWSVNTAGTGNTNGGITLDEYYVYNAALVDDVAIASDIVDPVTCEPSEANARLIAAAPELLEALEGYMDAVAQMNAAMQDGINVQGAAASLIGWEDNAKAAIAKATGEQA